MVVAQRLLAGHLSYLVLAGQHIWRRRCMTASLQHILHESLAERGNVAGHILQVWHSPFSALDVLCGALPSCNQPAVEPQEPPVKHQCQKQGHRGYHQPAIHLQAAVRASVDAESCGGICKGPGNQQPLEQQVPPEPATEWKQVAAQQQQWPKNGRPWHRTCCQTAAAAKVSRPWKNRLWQTRYWQNWQRGEAECQLSGWAGRIWAVGS